jgi:catalase
LRKEIDKRGTTLEVIAPKIGGAALSDGSWLTADQKVDGGPSVLYDAVAIVVSATGAELLAGNPAAKDFVSDAFAHAKFIGHVAAANPLFVATGVADRLDDGCIPLDDNGAAAAFIEACASLRFWPRHGFSATSASGRPSARRAQLVSRSHVATDGTRLESMMNSR